MIRELVVISGKGGTGKTSVAASLSSLAGSSVIADCDVDAANMHLVLHPHIQESSIYEGGKKASIDRERCESCGECIRYCRFDAITADYTVDPLGCEGCGVCVRFCPANAIEMQRHVSGKWFVSETPHGPLVHARLGIAEGNSGKLVTVIKKRARELAAEMGLSLIIVDGPPGAGCPVIASISGAALVLIVTEPTVSGIHDLKRIVGLAVHFHTGAAVCINKADINPDGAAEIEDYCKTNTIPILGYIPYDMEVYRAQIDGTCVVEEGYTGPAAAAIRRLWKEVQHALS